MFRSIFCTSFTMGTLLLASSVYGETKQDFEVFRKWKEIQHVIPERTITDFSLYLDDTFLERFKEKYEESFVLLNKLSPFLKTITAGQISEQGYQLKQPFNQAMKNMFVALYQVLENDPVTFIEFLKTHNFASSEINREEAELHFDYTIEKYKALTRLLFTHQDSYQEDIYLFALANRLVEYFFQAKTFPHYQDLLVNQKHHPIVRFLHTTVWYNLIGGGWKHWHKNCLDALKQKADQGSTVTYIAGGNDVYQLLKKGIYSIHIIDPFLSTQAPYYADGWDWFIRSAESNGGIGDTIPCTFDDTRIVLKRTKFVEGESFYQKLKNDKILELKKSVTQWTVFSSETQAPLGIITIDRRCTNQEDFSKKENKVLLLSYDELIYAISPELLNGWNIDIDKIEDSAHIYIKQFRNSLTKEMLKNMRIALLINLSDLKFIHFASDPN